MLAILDYDGTATTRECIELVLQRLVGDAWRPFEVEVRAGRMSHAECLVRQVELLRSPRDEIFAAMIDEALPSPGLEGFLVALAEDGGRTIILSAGFREVIEAVWRREELPAVELHASELLGVVPGADVDAPGTGGAATGIDAPATGDGATGDGATGTAAGAGRRGASPYSIAFSDVLGDCPVCGPGRCKGAAVRSLRRPGEPVLVFGDGTSDFCAAREADLIFARDRLAELCAAYGLNWRPLPDFTHVWDEVLAWRASPSGR